MQARSILLSFFLVLLLAPVAIGQVGVRKGAVVYHGSAGNTTAPAVVQEAKVRDATAEWKKIQAEGIDPDSAQGRQLVSQMNTRIRDAIKEVATADGRDMVTRKDDVVDKQGREVMDLTDKVVQKLGQ